jgi:hypothetical protein
LLSILVFCGVWRGGRGGFCDWRKEKEMRGLLAMMISAMSFMVAANDDWVDGWVC